MIMRHVLHMQALALDGEWENALLFRICLESMNMSHRSVWSFERNVGFTNIYFIIIIIIIRYFHKKMFKQRAHVSHNSFKFIFYERFYMYAQTKNICMIVAILIENKVAMSLQRLQTPQTLSIYGVAQNKI